MHEILTLQLGHPANYVATHFWNTQQSYFTYDNTVAPSPVDHDVHFRAGIGAGGVETYTPRTVVYDLKGGFGSLRKINALYEVDEENDDKNRNAIWNNQVVVQKEAQIEPSSFIKSLEEGTGPGTLTTDSVRYWSDFNAVYYHPRSLVQLYQYEVNSAMSPFENPEHGQSLFDSVDKEHDILDRDWRFFAEECDGLQGIQVFTTTDDGWGGFASKYLEALRDEFPKTELWTYGIERGEKVPAEKRIPRTLALANAISALVPTSSIYVPIFSPPASLPQAIKIDNSSQWHRSALLSMAIESVTLQTRIKDQNIAPKMAGVSALLNFDGNRNIASLSMAFDDLDHDETSDGRTADGAAASNGTNNVRKIKTTSSRATVDLSWAGEEKHVFARAHVDRGDSVDKGNSDSSRLVSRDRDGDEETLESSFHTALAFPILDSYPGIFPTRHANNKAVSLSSTLRTSSAVLSKLKMLRETVRVWAPFDDREALYDGLSNLESGYEVGWDSGSDSGEDD